MLGVQTGCVLELVPLSTVTGGGSPPSLASPPLDSPAHALHEGWKAAQAGLAKGLTPFLASSGSGGSYFMRAGSSDPHAVCVFKPKDEEPLAVNNPRPCLCGEPTGESCKVGLLPGEGAEREVIAYILDHDHLAGVPATAMVACQQQVRGCMRLVPSRPLSCSALHTEPHVCIVRRGLSHQVHLLSERQVTDLCI